MINSALGSGIKFPISLEVGKVKTADGVASVMSAIWMLFGTPKGKRFMLPEYGSNLYKLLFEPCNEMTGQMAAIYARDDIEAWIPRIEYVRVSYDLDNMNSIIRLIIYFKLVNSANEEMLIYPFYVNAEGQENRTLNPNYTTI